MKRLPSILLILSAGLLLGAEKPQPGAPKPDDPAAVEALRRVVPRPEFDEHGNVVRLTLVYRRELLVHVRGLHSLEWLRCPRGTTDADMADIGSLRTLQRLDLGDADITDEGMAHLSGLSELRCLYMPHTTYEPRITDGALAYLKDLKKLDRLSLARTNIGDAGLVHVSGLSNLRDLSLSRTKVTDAGLVHLRGLSKLRNLHLSGTRVSRDGVEPLQRALPYTIIWYAGRRDPRPDAPEAVAALERAGAEVKPSDIGRARAILFTGSQGDAELGHLKGLPYLEWLILGSETRVTDDGLAQLRKLPMLRSVDVSAPRVTDAGLAHLDGLLRLRSLKLRLPKLTDAGLAHLRTLANLEELDVSNTGVTDAGLVHLKEFSYLSKLDLSGTGVSDAGLEHLTELPSLRELNLTGTSVTDTGMEHLRGVQTIYRLYVRGTRVTKEGAARFKETHLRARIEYGPLSPEERIPGTQTDIDTLGKIQ